MEHHTVEVVTECAEGSHLGTLHFPEVVQKLLEAGVAQYHADFFRAENTYYQSDGDSHVVSVTMPSEEVALEFDASGVAEAVRASQQDGLHYEAFLTRVMQAGCSGYFVCLEGQRVLYLGRSGDLHIEYFPGSR